MAGKYRVERVLGEGGMGIVVAATHLQLDQLVALKFVRREVLARPDLLRRFEREVLIAAKLKGDHVARILDVGHLDDGVPYIVMEYLQGRDLGTLVKAYGRVPIARACTFIIQACDALAEAHDLGIVHRDVKPGNLFLADGTHGHQTIKVLDFGISKSSLAADDMNMTRVDELMGSPGYMSPEQMRSAKDVDGRSDVWSLGVVLYELLTGAPPFQADSLTALCIKVINDPIPALPMLPGLPPGIDVVVRRALERDPRARYASAAELACALMAFAEPEARDLAQRLIASAVSPAGSQTIALASGASQSFASMGPASIGSSSMAAFSRSVSTLDAASGEAQAPRPVRRRTGLWASLIAGTAVGIGAAIAIASAHLAPSAPRGEASGDVREGVTPAAPSKAEGGAAAAPVAPAAGKAEGEAAVIDAGVASPVAAQVDAGGAETARVVNAPAPTAPDKPGAPDKSGAPDKPAESRKRIEAEPVKRQDNQASQRKPSTGPVDPFASPD